MLLAVNPINLTLLFTSTYDSSMISYTSCGLSDAAKLLYKDSNNINSFKSVITLSWFESYIFVTSINESAVKSTLYVWLE